MPEQLPVRLSIDVPKITSSEAAILVVHHLALAAAYFEATSMESIEKELARARNANSAFPQISLEADRVWLKILSDTYDAIDARSPT